MKTNKENKQWYVEGRRRREEYDGEKEVESKVKKGGIRWWQEDAKSKEGDDNGNWKNTTNFKP